MKRGVAKLAKRRHPGPFPMGALPWAENASFFAPKVQAVLLRRKGILGWPIRCWRAVEVVTRRYDPKQEQGYRPWMQFNNEEEEQLFLRNRWVEFANCYNSDPDFVADLFVTMTSFHKDPPKKWPLPRKLACLSMLAEYEGDDYLPKGNGLLPPPAPPLRHSRMAEMLKKWFGNEKIGPERISVELSRERKRRRKIHAEWNEHHEHLTRLAEAKLTHTPTTPKK